ncbi:MAG TPA: AMP-binding protein, partial [Candidatus Obscuribacterales bacterium]
VGLIGPNAPEYLLALLGIWYCAGIVLPLNPRLPELQLELALRRGGARWCLGGPPGRRFLDWDELPGQGTQGAEDRLAFNPDSCFSLLLTSGSSEGPKLVYHDYGPHHSSALSLFQRFPLGPGDRWLLALPLFHVGGLAIVVRCMLSGATLVLPEPGQDLAEALVALRPSHLSLVATQLQRLLAQPEAIPVLQAAKFILLGGSAIPRSLLERAVALGLPVHTSYGSTETSSLVSCTPDGADLETLLTAGFPLPDQRLRIAADGEIQINSYLTVCEGYFESEASLDELCRPYTMPEAQVCWRGRLPSSVFSHSYHFERQLSADRDPETHMAWYQTRDRGFFDEAGRLHVIGRLDNLFISGGENIQPEEIEAALLSLAGITQAIVVPVADQEYGQRPVAFVETASWQPEAWRAQLRALLPSYKLPDAFYPWPAGQIGLKPSRAAFQDQAGQR